MTETYAGTPALQDLTLRLGELFRIEDGSGAGFAARLVEAAPLPASFGGRASPLFQLQSFWPQRSCSVSHPRWSEPMAIFLVPIGPPPGGTGGFLYQAVFD